MPCHQIHTTQLYRPKCLLYYSHMSVCFSQVTHIVQSKCSFLLNSTELGSSCLSITPVQPPFLHKVSVVLFLSLSLSLHLPHCFSCVVLQGISFVMIHTKSSFKRRPQRPGGGRWGPESTHGRRIDCYPDG